MKLKGNRPLIFHESIAKHVKIKGVVSLLKGASAEHNLLIIQLLSKLGKLE